MLTLETGWEAEAVLPADCDLPSAAWHQYLPLSFCRFGPLPFLILSLNLPSQPSCSFTSNVFIVNFLCVVLFCVMGQLGVFNLLESVHTFQHAICRKGHSAHYGLYSYSNQGKEMICDPHFPCELWLLLITVRMKYILVSASESKSLYCPLVYGNKIRTSQEVPKIPICTECISYQTKEVSIAHAEPTVILMIF